MTLLHLLCQPSYMCSATLPSCTGLCSCVLTYALCKLSCQHLLCQYGELRSIVGRNGGHVEHDLQNKVSKQTHTRQRNFSKQNTMGIACHTSVKVGAGARRSRGSYTSQLLTQPHTELSEIISRRRQSDTNIESRPPKSYEKREGISTQFQSQKC